MVLKPTPGDAAAAAAAAAAEAAVARTPAADPASPVANTASPAVAPGSVTGCSGSDDPDQASRRRILPVSSSRGSAQNPELNPTRSQPTSPPGPLRRQMSPQFGGLSLADYGITVPARSQR